MGDWVPFYISIIGLIIMGIVIPSIVTNITDYEIPDEEIPPFYDLAISILEWEIKVDLIITEIEFGILPSTIREAQIQWIKNLMIFPFIYQIILALFFSFGVLYTFVKLLPTT